MQYVIEYEVKKKTDRRAAASKRTTRPLSFFSYVRRGDGGSVQTGDMFAMRYVIH